MKFWKYQGTGNDFVVVEALDGRPAWLDAAAVIAICDRHFGVGADGILLLERGQAADWFMRVLNADGSEAEMCGNGIRCIAAHLANHRGLKDAVIPIETGAGVKACRLHRGTDGIVTAVTVSLGAPILEPAEIPVAADTNRDVPATVEGRTFIGQAVSMGNPHFVIFEGMDADDAAVWGARLTASPLFPRQANIEFVESLGPGHFRVVVFERGVGLTLACGTGAGAVGVAAVLTGQAPAGESIRVDVPGGPLNITVVSDFSDVLLEGPATLVFQGVLER
jgi:diaminopimelate epimerase